MAFWGETQGTVRARQEMYVPSVSPAFLVFSIILLSK